MNKDTIRSARQIDSQTAQALTRLTDTQIRQYNERLVSYARQFGTTSNIYKQAVTELELIFGAPNNESTTSALAVKRKSSYNKMIDVVQIRPANAKRELAKTGEQLPPVPPKQSEVKRKVASYRQDMSSIYSQYYAITGTKSNKLAETNNDLAQKFAIAFKDRALLNMADFGKVQLTKEERYKIERRINDLEFQLSYALMQEAEGTVWRDNETNKDELFTKPMY